MASLFPASVDTFSTPTAGSATSSPSHATLHVNVNNAITNAQTYMGMTLISTTTIGSTVSSVTVSSAFSTTYDNYKIIVSGGVGSDDPSNLLMTLGSTSTNYYWARVGRTFADVDNGGASGGSTSSWRIGGSSPTSLSMSAEIFNPFLSDQTIFAATNIYARTAGSIYSVAGYLNDTTSYTAFTLTPSSGTITGGTIRVYGYR